MTDQTAQEPTMEEILASIRRIISEDDAPAAVAAPAPQPEPEPEPAHFAPEPVAFAPEPEPTPVEDDVLELTDTYAAPTAQSIGDLDVHADAPEPEPFPVEPVSESIFAPEPVEASAPVAQDALVEDAVAATAASAFAGLASSLRKPEPVEPSTGTGPTLDELARSLLRPMLKEWLDANLPAIVEAQVRKEVERIARSAG